MQKSMSRTWELRCSIEWSAWKTHLIILWFSIEWHELQHYVPTTSFNPVLWVSTSTYAINHIIASPTKLSKSSSLRIKWRVTLGISTNDSKTRPPQTRHHRHASLSSFAEPHTKDFLGVLKASTCVSSVFFFFLNILVDGVCSLKWTTYKFVTPASSQNWICESNVEKSTHKIKQQITFTKFPHIRISHTSAHLAARKCSVLFVRLALITQRLSSEFGTMSGMQKCSSTPWHD